MSGKTDDADFWVVVAPRNHFNELQSEFEDYISVQTNGLTLEQLGFTQHLEAAFEFAPVGSENFSHVARLTLCKKQLVNMNIKFSRSFQSYINRTSSAL